MSMNCDGCEYDGFIMLGDKKASYCKYFKETKRNMDRAINVSYYPFQHGYCLHKTNEDELKNEALDLAIEALKQTENKDCIGREDAIEAIEGVDWYHVNSKGELVHGSTSEEESWYRAEEVYKAIESLPSVESEQTKMIKEIRKWINSGNRGNADYFIVDKIEEIINKYE